MKKKVPQKTYQSESRALILPGKGNLFERVVSILEQARANVVRAVNSNMVIAYWLIGREIVQELQGGEARAEYGEAVVGNLAQELTGRYGEGFSIPNLKNFRQFYLSYSDRIPEIGYTACSQLSQSRKSYTACSELVTNQKSHSSGELFENGFHPSLTWSHYRALMRVEKDNARRFYEGESVACGWSVRELERQIHSFYYERLLASRDKRGLLPGARSIKNKNYCLKTY